MGYHGEDWIGPRKGICWKTAIVCWFE